MKKILFTAAAIALFSAGARGAEAPPFWAYPINPPESAQQPSPDKTKVFHVPGSKEALNWSQTHDRYNPPDWFPGEHPKPPQIVAHGDGHAVWACGACHIPNGQGRPENASLAGQPADYIVQQVLEMRSGNRRSAQPEFQPPGYMLGIAQHVTAKDLHEAAAYFSKLKYTSRIRVVESATVPKTYVGGAGMLAASPGDKKEPIGNRIIEIPENFDLTELRDPHSGFIAYVPPGSIARGKILVETGGGAAPCSSCHGGDLKGVGETPALAGRSPSYLYRQLFDIQHGSRRGPAVALMLPEVAHLNDADRIAIVAYIASLKP